MKFSYNFLQSFFKKKLPPAEELAEKLMMRFFEVEEMKKTNNDIVMDIDILPSRAGDSLSHIGVVREISAITGMEYEKPKAEVKEKGEDISDKTEVKVRDACSRYILRGIKNVKIKPSPVFIKNRLKSCGIKPINNVVDIMNYVMLETGQPLHAFDGKKLQGGKIVVRFAREREKIVTLDEKRYELKSNILVIADELLPIAIAGIKGGIIPEVDKNTSFVLLEAATFDPRAIRRGSKLLNLRTDASLRFEHGISPELAEEAIDRAASLVAEIAGGEALKGKIDHYSRKAEKREVAFEAQEIRDILGADVPLKEMERILRALEFKVKRENSFFNAEVPAFRTDVSIKEDIAEEIGRIYGYENIASLMPKEEISPKGESVSLQTEEACRDILQKLGFVETYNYSFINDEDVALFKYDNLTEMEKPVSLEYRYLRPGLLPGLLKNVKKNENNFNEISMFELGKVFPYGERKAVGGVLAPADFYKLKGRLEAFFKELSLENISYVPDKERACFNRNRAATIVSGKEEIGFLGEVSLQARRKAGMKKSAVMFELDFQKLLDLKGGRKTYKPIVRFPFVIRDLAILVPRETPYEELAEKIKKEGGKLLSAIELFDIYEGKSIPKGKKNFAFRLSFQAKNRTLSSKEVNKLQEKLIKALDEIPGWQVRK